MGREIRTPGAEEPKLPALELNNTDTDPNTAAAAHEARAHALLAADLMANGKTDQALEVMAKAGQITRELAALPPSVEPEAANVPAGIYGDEIERVSVPSVRRNADVDRYGPELPYPAGTRLNLNMEPCSGAEEAAFYVGNLLVKGRGWLIGRPIPVEGGPADPNRPQPAASEAA